MNTLGVTPWIYDDPEAPAGYEEGQRDGYEEALGDVSAMAEKVFPMDEASRRLVATVLRRVAAASA